MTLVTATDKQREILVAYIRWGSIKQAAFAVGIKEQAARHRLQSLYRRTGTANAVQAAYLLGLEHRKTA